MSKGDTTMTESNLKETEAWLIKFFDLTKDFMIRSLYKDKGLETFKALGPQEAVRIAMNVILKTMPDDKVFKQVH